MSYIDNNMFDFSYIFIS